MWSCLDCILWLVFFHSSCLLCVCVCCYRTRMLCFHLLVQRFCLHVHVGHCVFILFVCVRRVLEYFVFVCASAQLKVVSFHVVVRLMWSLVRNLVFIPLICCVFIFAQFFCMIFIWFRCYSFKIQIRLPQLQFRRKS